MFESMTYTCTCTCTNIIRCIWFFFITIKKKVIIVWYMYHNYIQVKQLSKSNDYLSVMKILKFRWQRRKLYGWMHTMLPTDFLQHNIYRYRILIPYHIIYWRDPLHAALLYTYRYRRGIGPYRLSYSETLVETLVTERFQSFKSVLSFSMF